MKCAQTVAITAKGDVGSTCWSNLIDDDIGLLAAALRHRAEVYGNRATGNFLVYGAAEAAEDMAAAAGIERLRALISA